MRSTCLMRLSSIRALAVSVEAPHISNAPLYPLDVHSARGCRSSGWKRCTFRVGLLGSSHQNIRRICAVKQKKVQISCFVPLCCQQSPLGQTWKPLHPDWETEMSTLRSSRQQTDECFLKHACELKRYYLIICWFVVNATSFFINNTFFILCALKMKLKSLPSNRISKMRIFSQLYLSLL